MDLTTYLYLGSIAGQGVGRCQTCSALVADIDMNTHHAWHERISEAERRLEMLRDHGHVDSTGNFTAFGPVAAEGMH
jgi:hypothetical protein